MKSYFPFISNVKETRQQFFNKLLKESHLHGRDISFLYDIVEQFKDDFKSLDKFQFGIPFQQVLNIKRIIETTPGNVGKAMFYIWEADLVFGIDKLMAAGAYITAEIEARKLLN